MCLLQFSHNHIPMNQHTSSSRLHRTDRGLCASRPLNLTVLACHEYASFLCQTYLDDTITSHQKWPPVSVRKYINLASINNYNKRELDASTKAAVFLGNIDAIICKKEPFHFDQLAKLPDGSKPKLVLVEGAPGAGKSTFAWKFCRK